MFRIRRDGTYLEFAGDVGRLASPPETLVGSNIFAILPLEVAEPLMACAESALPSGELRTVEYRLRTLDEAVRDFEARVAVCAPDEVLMIVRDVTERKRTEEELRRSRARIVEASETERRRLERNLHDGAQQALVSVSHFLELARRRIDADVDAARDLLAPPRSSSRARTKNSASSRAASTRSRSRSAGCDPHSSPSRNGRPWPCASRPRPTNGCPAPSRSLSTTSSPRR
jgi:PAS domain-containing protein